ncbi:hypothetical protein AB0P21_06950 [Kribbella sp. NPDC056861]|uniref:hypothetical protein n=1 Tax=Kribbella sp. NPDC056861 TaxID=3154857 RepID=UPI00341A21B2
MSKFLGFLLGIAVALVGPAMFGVLAADGGIKLNAKEMALAYGIGALIFWTVASYFAGAAALGAALTFGAMIYTVHWIPNRLTNFLNDVPGVTTGMIDGIKQYTLNGVVPILAVISLIFGIQSIVRSVQRRRRARVEADRLQREQEAAVQAQQMPEPPVAVAAVAPGDYPAENNRFGNNFGNSNYDDLFDDEPVETPFKPRNQADEQTTQFDPAAAGMAYSSEAGRDDTAENEHDRDDRGDETVLVPTDSDQTVLVPTDSDETELVRADEQTVADDTDSDETVVAASPQVAPVQRVDESEDAAAEARTAPGVAQADAEETVVQRGGGSQDDGDATQPVPVPVPVPEPEAPKHVAPRVAGNQQAVVPEAAAGAVAGAASPVDDGGEPTQAMPVSRPQATQAVAPVAPVEDDGGEATQAVPVTRRDTGVPVAGTHSAAPREDDGGEATQAVPVTRPDVAGRAPAPQSQTPQASASQASQASGYGATTQSAAQDDDGGEATQAVPVTRPQATAPTAPSAPATAPQDDDGGEPTQAVPVNRPQAAAPAAPPATAPQAPASPVQAPQASAPQAAAPELFDQEDPRSQAPAPWAAAPRSDRSAGSNWDDDGGEATQAVPVSRPETDAPVAPQTHTPQAGLHRKEEMGQQYRERMDPPDVDDTGEFFMGAFESPTTEQSSSRMELPGHFRPAGT